MMGGKALLLKMRVHIVFNLLVNLHVGTMRSVMITVNDNSQNLTEPTTDQETVWNTYICLNDTVFDVSLGKPTMSSSPNNAHSSVIYHAGLFSNDYLMNTFFGQVEWWQVDLEEYYNISVISISYRVRANHSYDSLHDLLILTSLTADFNSSTSTGLCVYKSNMLTHELTPEEFDCSYSAIGRYVRILFMLLYGNGRNILIDIRGISVEGCLLSKKPSQKASIETNNPVRINRRLTSVYMRKFTSAKDDRISSKTIGYIGTIVLCLQFGVIVMSDVRNFIVAILKKYQKFIRKKTKRRKD